MGQKVGICVGSGIVFENRRDQWFELWPSPFVSGAVFVDSAKEQPQIAPLDKPGGMLFREDSFDATTRIRRGRFYNSHGGIDTQPVFYHFSSHADLRGPPRVHMHHFADISQKPTAKLVAIGVEDSVWRILGAERISTGEWLVTLKARGGAGLLPEINADAIPEAGRSEVIKAVNRMVDVAHRETPGSIVDVARNTAPLLMTVYAAALEVDASKQREVRHKDLGKVCAHFEHDSQLKQQEVAIATGRILARLHPRNKPNEQRRYDLRPVTEDDATFAVSAIGLLLNEFRWTQETARVASSVDDTGASP